METIENFMDFKFLGIVNVLFFPLNKMCENKKGFLLEALYLIKTFIFK